MKTNTYQVALGLCLLMTACSATSQPVTPKFFNTNEFVGLTSFSNHHNEIRLDYELDASQGGNLKLGTCLDVARLQEDAVLPPQQHLLKLMQVDCMAAQRYGQAADTSVSFWPKVLDADVIRQLPAQAVPDLGGDAMSHRAGRLVDSEPGMKMTKLSGQNIQALLSGDLDINYVLLARADVDKDGFEDLLLRLDWRITTAHGKGFDLLMLSKTASDQPAKITWRWGMP